MGEYGSGMADREWQGDPKRLDCWIEASLRTPFPGVPRPPGAILPTKWWNWTTQSHPCAEWQINLAENWDI
jgi:hypothetical protein